MSLKDRLKYKIPFVLEDFSQLYQRRTKLKPEIHTQLMLSDKTYQELFDCFCDDILKGIENKKFIPVYRMADGEFKFINKRLFGKFRSIDFIKSIKNKIKYLLNTKYMYGRKIQISRIDIIKNIFDPGYNLVAHGEGYSKTEISYIKERFPFMLGEVLKEGKLALHFVERENILIYENDINPFLKWLDNNNIQLNENNYVPFYHVYAILNGKIRKQLFKNRTILVITNYDGNKRLLIEDYLSNKEGVKKVQFIKISSNKSMIEKIDINKYVGKIDLVLVGAGIGSINILLQLKPLSVPCLDIGYALECMANNNLRRDRMFLELR